MTKSKRNFKAEMPAPASSAISKLPMELLLHILRHLELEDLWTLRRTDRWLYTMLRAVPPYPHMLSPWLTQIAPDQLVERAEVVQSVSKLQFRLVDLPIRREIENYRISGTIAWWRLDKRTLQLHDLATGKRRTLHFDSNISKQDVSASRAAVATVDHKIQIYNDPFDEDTSPIIIEAAYNVEEIGTTVGTTIARDAINRLWYIADGKEPVHLEDVDSRWDMVLLDATGKTLYLFTNEGRRGISYESIDFATMTTTKHRAQTVGTIQGDEETHGWINRHSKLWHPNQPVYFIHSTCPAGERLQVIKFNPQARKGRHFVTGRLHLIYRRCIFPSISKSPPLSSFPLPSSNQTSPLISLLEFIYAHRIRSFATWNHILLYDHLGRGAANRGLMAYDFRTKRATKFLDRDVRECQLRISEGGEFLYWRKSLLRMTVVCFNQRIQV